MGTVCMVVHESPALASGDDWFRSRIDTLYRVASGARGRETPSFSHTKPEPGHRRILSKAWSVGGRVENGRRARAREHVPAHRAPLLRVLIPV